MCRVTFFILIFISCSKIFSQETQYRFAKLDITDGLSHNEVNTIIKDERGFIWFGTMTGLNRYDGYTFKVFKHIDKDTSSISDDYISQVWQAPQHNLLINTRTGLNLYNPLTEKFSHNLTAYFNALHLPQANITAIKKDNKNRFWFLYNGIGLYCYNPSSNTTLHIKHSTGDNSGYSDSITDISINPEGEIWIANTTGVLEKINPQTGKVIFRTNTFKNAAAASADYRLFVDDDGDVWIYPQGESNGVYYYKTYENKLLHIDKDAAQLRLNNNIITGVLQDDKGMIWIATDHGGINLINKKNYTVHYLVNREDDDKTISQNAVTALYKDNQNIVWIGTYKKGISYYNDKIFSFALYRHRVADKNSLQDNDVNRFVEDSAGNLWIGTNGGGLIYFNRKTEKFTQYKHDALNQNSLSNDVIVSLCIDHSNKLWIGTYFGGLDCFDGKRFVHHRHVAADTNSIADDRVWEIFEDAQNRLWIGLFSNGLDLFDSEHNRFKHYPPSNNTLHSGYISSLLEDKKGNLWIGTAVGITVWQNHTNKFYYYNHSEANNNSLSNDNIICLLEDANGKIWIGTRAGLNVFNPETNSFRRFNVDDGLPDNTILNILEDNGNTLWISTPNGISKIIVSDKNGNTQISCTNYNESDGLQGMEFNENAALKTKTGELIFGGANGFNIFNPPLIKKDYTIPNVVLTGFQVFNKDVSVGEKQDNNIILSTTITATKALNLKYKENVFSIEFAALNFINNKKSRYMYMLQGFDKNWLPANNTRKVTYTNLDAGNYTFKVKASNEDGVWNNTPTTLTITVLPPLWRTTFAYILYALAIIAILFFARRFIIQKAQDRFAMAQERKEAQRLHELDMLKILFITNISHEFKTPLSLILTPLDKLIKNTKEEDKKNQLQLVQRNAKRLLNLVNQLLDFRKMEAQELKLHAEPGNIIGFIKDVSFSFTDIADRKNIGFEYHSSIAELYTVFDHDKIERILFNFLSNAFKFTPQNGKVSVNINAEERNNESLVTISVKDNGIGIPKENQQKIFERFFQEDMPDSIINQGSGIGLSISKEFIKLHNGNITVESEPGKGSNFIVQIPFKKIIATEQPALFDENIHNNIQIEEINNKAGKKPVLLLVEDNDDFRFYLKDNLKQHYIVEEAANGKEGWQKALSAHPDIIVCDVSMPVMNGIELCNKIKHDTRTEQIPVIFLTALGGEEEQLKGLLAGAADYIAKPFNFEILLSRTKNILQQQQAFKKVYTRQVQAQPTEIAITTEEDFVQRALKVVEENISNAGFSVEDLSRKLFVSRVMLYKRILSLTGKTPSEFIRSVRMQRAAQLLQKSKMTVAEIAYKVGFNNPKYFSRHFKEEFNIIPSAYQSQHKQANK